MAISDKKGLPSINVTPLIDVLLVLLIIFMVITPNKPHKFETKVAEKPPVDQEKIEAPVGLLILSIDKARNLSINSQPLARESLTAQLQELLAKRPTDLRTLYIRAPRELPYEEIVNVIDAAKGAGALGIGLQIDYLDEI